MAKKVQAICLSLKMSTPVRATASARKVGDQTDESSCTMEMVNLIQFMHECMYFVIIYANAQRDAIVLTFLSALVLFCLYVEKYEVKRCKTLAFYSFACQYCDDSFVIIVFSYLEPHTRVHTHIIRL